jgi:hypothetical protein
MVTLTGCCTHDDVLPVRLDASIPLHDVLCHLPPAYLQPWTIIVRPNTATHTHIKNTNIIIKNNMGGVQGEY